MASAVFLKRQNTNRTRKIAACKRTFILSRAFVIMGNRFAVWTRKLKNPLIDLWQLRKNIFVLVCHPLSYRNLWFAGGQADF